MAQDFNAQANNARGRGQLPQVNFATFVLSLSSSALVHLGEIEDPDACALKRNFQAAKQTIDILAMLKEKTEGNLTSEEEKLIQTILTDLRMRYVKETNKCDQ